MNRLETERANDALHIVALGGTPFSDSSTEKALRIAADAAAASRAKITFFDGPFLARLPSYLTVPWQNCAEARDLIAAIRTCDGVLIASPGWHGSVAGFLKNALDYIEETAKDSRPYFDGLPVGLIATAYGWQAAAGTLVTLRSITHALRGWPTPLGVSVNSAGGIFDGGNCKDEKITDQLRAVGRQVVQFAKHVKMARSVEQA